MNALQDVLVVVAEVGAAGFKCDFETFLTPSDLISHSRLYDAC